MNADTKHNVDLNRMFISGNARVRVSDKFHDSVTNYKMFAVMQTATNCLIENCNANNNIAITLVQLVQLSH